MEMATSCGQSEYPTMHLLDSHERFKTQFHTITFVNRFSVDISHLVSSEQLSCSDRRVIIYGEKGML